MAKNFADIYGSQNPGIALNQKIFVVEEVTSKGTLEASGATDFLFTLEGGSVNYTQPVSSSPYKSGRHHTSGIPEKTETSWTIPSYFNIDTTLGAAGVGEIDPAIRVLMKSLFGKEDVTGGSPVYTTATDPATTFSIFQNLDVCAVQAPGSFVESGNMTFPGDGNSQIEFAGSSKTAYLVGIGKSTTDNNGGNTITLQAGEGERFSGGVGGMVMIVEADGTTRSAETASPRVITDVTGDVVTIDGAVLADADGSAADIYLTYWEPDSITSGINDPQTGLEGSVSIAGFSTITNCVRSASFNCVNGHELVNYCFGNSGLGGELFVPGERHTCTVTLEINLTKDLVAFLNNIRDFAGESITLILGDSTSRYMQIECPKTIFPVPEIPIGASGSIPITFEGLAYQTALDSADEITVSFL